MRYYVASGAVVAAVIIFCIGVLVFTFRKDAPGPCSGGLIYESAMAKTNAAKIDFNENGDGGKIVTRFTVDSSTDVHLPKGAMLHGLVIDVSVDGKRSKRIPLPPFRGIYNVSYESRDLSPGLNFFAVRLMSKGAPLQERSECVSVE